eukprot:4657867-Prymnesium_polylepis.2
MGTGRDRGYGTALMTGPDPASRYVAQSDDPEISQGHLRPYRYRQSCRQCRQNYGRPALGDHAVFNRD